MWLILLSLEFVTINHQQFWHPIMFSMILMVLHKSSTILAPNNLFLMIIMLLYKSSTILAPNIVFDDNHATPHT